MKLPLKIAYDTFVQASGRLLAGLLNLAVVVLLTRQLGRSTWADYVTITSYISIFTLVADFGLNSIFVREIIENPEKRQSSFENLLSLRLGLALIAVFIALAGLSFTSHGSAVKLGIIIGIFVVLAQSVSFSTNAIFQAFRRFDYSVLADFLGNIFLLTLVGFLAIVQASVFLIIVIYLLANLVKALVALVLVRSYVRPGLRFETNYWKSLLMISWPLGLSALFSQITANIDKQVVALASYQPTLGQNGKDAVAIYGLAYRIFDFVISFPSFVINSVFPVLIERTKQDQHNLKNLATKIFWSVLGLGVLALLVSYLSAGYLIPIFGNYPEAVVSFRILALSLPLFFVTSLGFGLFIILKKEKLLPLIYGFAALFNFVANYYFVPKFGYNTAAVLTGVTELIILLLMVVFLTTFFKSANEDN
ncbi:MAG: oligosaccharide flippase family protein [bacterium]|nr:oligosaccharide flippase family protein [bacterium]